MDRTGGMLAAPYVIVVGGSQGIGLEVARRHGALGFDVVILGRRKNVLKKAAADLEASVGHKQKVIWASCDAADAAALSTVLSKLVSGLGTPRLCYFLMGRPDPSYFEESGASLFLRQMEANYLTAVNCARAMLPLLAGNAPSGFVFASTFLSIVPMPGFSAYAAAKSAVLGFANSLRVEFLRTSLSITCLVSTAVDTPGFAEEAKTCNPDLIDVQLAVPLLRAKDVAHEAVDAALRGKFLVLPGWRAKLLHNIHRHFPQSLDFLIRRFGPQINTRNRQ